MAKGTQNKNAVAQQQQQQPPKKHHLSVGAGKTGAKKSGGGSANLHHSHHSTSHPEVNGGEAQPEATVKPNNNSNKLETAETDGEGDETKQKQNAARDSTSSVNQHEKHGERSGGRGGGRFIIKNLWDVCCNETESEAKELDAILKKLGLPSINYSKTKAYDITDYEYPPDLQNCKSKDFLDFYVFPYLLPAIQALIQFARVNRVFQCRFCTFNALDYIVEYLYNNNPRYPERFNNPTPIFEIPFARQWLEKHPRKPPPKWMLMSSEEAAIIIQRAIRGYMVRCRPEVQEMRQFWREFRKDLEEEKQYYQYGKNLPKNFPAAAIYSPYYEEYRGEFEETCELPGCIPRQFVDSEPPSPSVSHHSDHCMYCQAFRKFLDAQPEEILKSYQKSTSAENLSAIVDTEIRLSSAEEGSGEGVTTDTGGEYDENSGKEKGLRKESGFTQQPEAPPVPTSSSKVMKNQKPPPASVQQKSFTQIKGKQDKKAKKHD